jgi:serine/threonine protein kinase
MLIGDRFQIKKEIGRGGVGVVYLAVDTKNNLAPVVIKVLLEQTNEKAQKWIDQHFRDEVKALTRINHPGVAQFIDSGITEDGKPFLAMEFIDGSDLRSQIDPNRGLVGDFERVARVIRQLGAAISAAHDKGIYHRDLKPENILLQSPRRPDEEEQVKVIDFGIATVKDTYDDKTKTMRLFAGSRLYMAPEQIKNKPTAASDIYAMGVMAYEMLTGRVPFMPDLSDPIADRMQLIKMQSGGVRVKPKDLRPSLPDKAQKVLLKALAFKTSERPARAEDFGNELAKALLSFPEPASEAKREPAIRRWLIVATIFLITAVIGIATWSKINGAIRSDSAKTIEPMGQEQTLTYWVELQKYHGDAPIEKPTKLTGGIIGEAYFNTGDGLRFFIRGSVNGYLYLINESAKPAGMESSYIILFPSMEANKGTSKVDRGQQIETSEFIFDENAGTEKVWIIWSDHQVEQLEEALRKWSNTKDGGEIKEAKEAEYLSKLIGKYSSAKLKVEPDEANDGIRLRGYGDVLVYGLKLNHR